MSHWIAAILLLVFVNTCPSAIAGEFICGHDEETGGGGSALDLDSRPRARFVYVSFPGDVSGVLTQEHLEVLNTLKTYYSELSRGSFTFDDSSDLILHQDEVIGENGETATAWAATAPADFYADDIFPENFEGAIECESWLRLGQSHYATALCAEILWEIRDEWKEENVDFLDNTDYLIMILLTRGNPFGNLPNGTKVEGRALIAVEESALYEDEFFDGLARSGQQIKGTIQLFVAETGTPFSPRESAKGIAHEVGHTLGAGDGPPNQKFDHPVLAEYLYGNRNLMCQTQVPGEGIPPIGLGWLQDFDWRGDDPDPLVVDFAGENLIDHKMIDIALPGGKLYRFKPDSEALPDGAFEDQYFLMAYHSQTGWIDTQENDEGEYLTRGPGVEIWHCIGDSLFDMESASGLFMDPREPGSTDLPVGWLEPDSISGYDNHDMWPQIGLPLNSYPARDPVDYASYVGEAGDFFGVHPVEPEFSNFTNPSSAWYRNDSNEILRRNPQDLYNSLTMDVIQDNGDGSIQVNLLSGPYEAVWVTYPDPENPELHHGDTLKIEWGTENPAGLLNSVEIYFSGDAGDNYQLITPPGRIDFADHEFFWTVPYDLDGTQHGWLKVVYFKSDCPLGGPFVYPRDHLSGPDPDPIHIDHPVPVKEDILSPADGSGVFANTPVRIEWSAFFNDEAHGGFGPDYGVEVTSVDLDLKIGGSWVGIAAELVLDDSAEGTEYYHYDETAGVNFYNWTATNSQVVPDGQIRLTLHYTKGEFGSQETSQMIGDFVFSVYPLTIKFEDRSSDAKLLPRQDGGYNGMPNCVAAMDFDGDEDIDFFLGMVTGDDPFLDDNYAGEFTRVYEPFPLDGRIGQNQAFAVHGDFNGDGYPDLFCGRENDPRLYLNGGPNAIPVFTNVEGDLARDVRDLLPWTTSAAWIDIDHDQDLDLILGRAEPNGVGGGKTSAPDYFLINNGSALSSWTRTPFGLDSPTLAVAAMDFDKDGYWEIAVGSDETSYGLRIFREQVDGGFSRVNQVFPAGAPAQVCNLAWVDINNDGWFDLVEHDPGQEAIVLINDQNGWFSDALPLEEVKTLEFIDFNGDGWMDYISSKAESGVDCGLWMNLGGHYGFADDFVNAKEAAGLTGTGVHLGSVVSSPFSDDAAPDLFMARSEEDDRLFVAVDASDPMELLDGDFVSISLVKADDPSVPYPAYGASVLLEDSGGEHQLLRFEGEAAFGSQKAQLLTFGLGHFSGQITATVFLPDGRVLNKGTIDSQARVFPLFIDSSVQEDINIYNPLAYSVVLPDSRRDIHFQWTTDLRCENTKDRVFISNSSGDCELPDTLGIDQGLSNLHYSMVRGEDGKYHHEFILQDVPCYAHCSFDYQVQSGTGDLEDQGVIRSLSAKACGATVPWDPSQD